MKMSLARVVMVLTLVLLIWAGCSKKGDGPVGPKPFNEAIMTLYVTAPLPTGFTFRLWAKAADTTLHASVQPWIPLTRFNVNNSGRLLDSTGAAIADDRIKGLPVNLDDYDSLEVTIERTSGLAATPSETVYLHGQLPADLTNAHLPLLEFPFALGQGQSAFMMLTPTDSDTSDELSGVWFFTKDPPGPSDSGLTVPPAPSGWLYEGWVHHGGSHLSTGRFRRAVGSDMDNPYCGAGTKPAFPGEDFIQNAPSGLGFSFPFSLTRGDLVTIAIEPDFEPGLGYFGVTVLTTTLSGTIVPSTLTLMDWSLEEWYPSATLDIRRADAP